MVNVQSAYYEKIGRLLGALAHAEQMCNSVIATAEGLSPEARTAREDEMAEMPLRTRLNKVTVVSADVLGPDHETTEFLRGRARELVEIRNHVAHGYVTGASLSEWWIKVRTGIYSEGYQDVTIDLDELERAVADANELIPHVVCLWTQQSGSGASPMRIEELDE